MKNMAAILEDSGQVNWNLLWSLLSELIWFKWVKQLENLFSDWHLFLCNQKEESEVKPMKCARECSADIRRYNPPGLYFAVFKQRIFDPKLVFWIPQNLISCHSILCASKNTLGAISDAFAFDSSLSSANSLPKCCMYHFECFRAILKTLAESTILPQWVQSCAAGFVSRNINLFDATVILIQSQNI